jgi:hypothetical protein
MDKGFSNLEKESLIKPLLKDYPENKTAVCVMHEPLDLTIKQIKHWTQLKRISW